MSDSKSAINKGVIFENDRKGNKRAPTKIGKFIDENGIEKRIAIWENISKKGLKYETLVISDIVEYVKEPFKDVEANPEINVMPF